MSKQIKIGLDKVPAPVTKQFTQLVDIEGTKLFDAAGNPLVTEEEAALTQFTSTENSLSVFVNNDSLRTIPIEEQFSDTSAVSSSLLGIPRAEEQLALFSDVATYGLDEDQWNEYILNDGTYPEEWYRKENPLHGRREGPSFNEGSKEQALYLKIFPTQHGFPTGTVENQLEEPTEGFREYMNFIALGKFLYNKFVGFDSVFANKFLIDSDCAYIVNQNEIPISTYNLDTNPTKAVFSGNGDFHDVEYGKSDIQDSFDAIERWTYLFDQIKAGTVVWPTMTGSANTDYTQAVEYSKVVNFATEKCTPGANSNFQQIAVLESKRAFRYQPGRASGFTFGSRLSTESTTTNTYLEMGCSNDTDEYMFQLRGSQFNIVRRSTIKMPEELLIRQGLSADDQSSTAIFPRGIGNSNAQWETVIPRSKFNGDALLGDGDSGYILSFEDVTMYKIEFSWYGAIGAKFYAYVPVGNGDARWVLMHTFVIENGLGQPVLNNPDFKFKYIIYSEDQANIRAPVYLYKYGSSYYVDGGDEGTIRLSTTTASSKSFQTNTPVIGLLPKNEIKNSVGVAIDNYKKSYPSTIAISSDKTCRIDVKEVVGSPQGTQFNFSPGIYMKGNHPKSRSLNFQFASEGQINIVQPADASITGTVDLTQNSKNVVANGGSGTQFLTDIRPGDAIVVTGGDGTEYQVEHITSNTALILKENFASANVSGATITVVHRLNSDDKGAKIIADGVYGVYVNPSYASNGQSTDILRRNIGTYALSSQNIRDGLKVDGSILKASDLATFTGVLSNYNTIFASTRGIYSNNFKIHFLNPGPRNPAHASNHWGEFSVGVTPYLPIAPGGDADANKVQFEFASGSYKDYDIDEFPTIEYCHDRVRFDQKNRAEQYEWDPSYGDQMSVDPRLPSPKGNTTGDVGYISTVVGKVNVVSYKILSAEAVGADGSQFANMVKITFANGESGPANNLIKFDGTTPLSEVGTNLNGTGIFFTSLVITPSVGNAYVYVQGTDANSGASSDGSPDGAPDIIAKIDATANSAGEKFIQTKILQLTHDWRATTFDENGVERFTDNQFSKSQAMPFGITPLYPVFALQDHARANSIVIEEISLDGTVKTSTPSFVTEQDSYNTGLNFSNGGGIRTDGNSNSVDAPCAFNSDERLAGCRYDTSMNQPLRSGTQLFSFHVDANIPARLDIQNIFAVDRKGVSTGLLNNKAIYFTATSLDGQQGTIEATITVKEQ